MSQYFQRTVGPLEEEREERQEPYGPEQKQPYGQEQKQPHEQEQEPEPGEQQPEPGERRPTGSPLADLGDRIARALASFDRGRVDQLALRHGDDSTIDFPFVGADAEPKLPSRFPVGPLGYNRTAVDQHLAELERELEQLRGQSEAPGMSISEEIERLGEQTASILVVAHDQAHETARLAQEQADRRVAEATANAVAVTEEAKRQLRELDNETDAVWRERRRLIEDVRSTGSALVALATEAAERFPEEPKAAADPAGTSPS